MGAGQIYSMTKVAEGTGRGMMKQTNSGAPSVWLPYMGVDDIKASTQMARSLGARVKKDLTDVMGMGWLSILVDPTGATIGLWQEKAKS